MNTDDKFPLSNKQSVKGTRHLAREKTLQVLAACAQDHVDKDVAFRHVFFRQFTFDPKENTEETGRILREEEVHELEADVQIEWSQEDLNYAVTVLQRARDAKQEISDLIDKHSKNWELGRIALLDKILMTLAVAELEACSDIPIKVTINETIELAKRYSTDKSGVFINGVLDAVIIELTEQSRIIKSGRGLIE